MRLSGCKIQCGFQISHSFLFISSRQEFKEEPQSNSTLNYINSSYDNYVPFIEVKQEQEYINDESDASIHYENEEYLEDDSFEEPTTSKTEIQSWNDDTDEEEEKVDVKKEKFEFSIKKINKKSEIPRRLRAKVRNLLKI